MALDLTGPKALEFNKLVSYYQLNEQQLYSAFYH